MRAATSSDDRLQAILVWPGLFVAPCVAPAVILALNWSNRESLAWRHAIRALILLGAVFAVHVPTTIWAFALGNHERVYYIVLAVNMTVMLVVILVSFVQALRAPIVPPLGAGTGVTMPR